jgi:hypothetical protein
MAFVQNQWSIAHVGARTITPQVQRDNNALGRRGRLDQIFADLSPIPLVKRQCQATTLDLLKDLDCFIEINHQIKTKIEQILGVCFLIDQQLIKAIEPDFPAASRLIAQELLKAHQKALTEETPYAQYCRGVFELNSDPLGFLSLSIETIEKTAASRVELQVAITFLQDCLDKLQAEIEHKRSRHDFFEAEMRNDDISPKSLSILQSGRSSSQPDFFTHLLDAKGRIQPQLLAQNAQMIQRLLEKK